MRLIFDNNYFNALYQGIPNGGYTQMVANMLQGVEVRLGVNYLANKAELDALADRVIYTGPIDAYFDYSLGTLQYRSVRFETETLACPNYQGNAVINYTDAETPYTRSTMTRTAPCTPSTRHWPMPSRTLCSAAAWASISTMIWTR